MAIKKRTFSRYVNNQADGEITLRTPAACTNWSHDFRLRIVRDYLAPKTLVILSELTRRYDKSAQYIVQGRRLQFVQPLTRLQDMPAHGVILHTAVIDIDRELAMQLIHPDPVMRVLMVYSFVTDSALGGVAAYSTYRWKTP